MGEHAAKCSDTGFELARPILIDRVSRGASQALGTSVRIRDIRRMTGGVSSLTYLIVLERDGSANLAVVVKVAPAGLAPVRNRDVLRQSCLMAALAGRHPVPVPRILFEDSAAPPMFAMEAIAGQAYEPLLDVHPDPPSAPIVAVRALTAARTLADLQQVRPEEIGRHEPRLRPQDELDRWATLLKTVDPALAPGHNQLHERLAARVPPPAQPTIVHGDYRLANMIFAGTRLGAVVDWELWSVGDPRLDLAWLLMHSAPAHRFHRARPEADLVAGTGMPTAESLLGAYREQGHSGPEDQLDWFVALSYYKVAATVAALAKRNRRSATPSPDLVVAGESLAGVVMAGHGALDGGFSIGTSRPGGVAEPPASTAAHPAGDVEPG